MLVLSKHFLIAVAIVILSALPAHAAMEWIDLPVSTGGSVKALLGVPDGVTNAPGVVYSHGSKVRRQGYEASKKGGYDVADWVEALNKAGYVAIAPVRDSGVLPNPLSARKGDVGNESSDSMIQGLEQGIASLQAATALLKAHPTATGKVGALGFSEGGLVTTWAAIRGLDADALVLMSPATIRSAKRLNMKNASEAIAPGSIAAPVLLTLGKRDNAAILKGIPGRLIPALQDAGVNLETKLDYPGDHSWFWRVRDQHFTDVRAFLDRYLK